MKFHVHVSNSVYEINKANNKLSLIYKNKKDRKGVLALAGEDYILYLDGNSGEIINTYYFKGKRLYGFGKFREIKKGNTNVYAVGFDGSQSFIMSFDYLNSPRISIMYQIGITVTHFSLNIGRFYKNIHQNALFLGEHQFQYYSFYKGDLTPRHMYNLGSDMCIKYPHVVTNHNMTYVVLLGHPAPENYAWYFEMNKNGEMSAFKKIQQKFDSMNHIVYDKYRNMMKFIGMYNEETIIMDFFIHDSDVLLYKDKNKHINLLSYLGNYTMLLLYSSEDQRTSYIVRETKNDIFKDFNCSTLELYHFLSLAIPDRRTYKIQPLTVDRTFAFSEEISVDPLGNQLEISSLNICPNYMLVPKNRVSAYPFKYKHNTFSNVRVNNFFWTKSEESTIDVELYDKEGEEVEWLDFEKDTGDIVGTTGKYEGNDEFIMEVFTGNESSQFELELKYKQWDDSNCELCINYEWPIKPDKIWNYNANIVGSMVLAGVTIITLLSTLCLNPKSNFQTLAILSEYFQLLLTLLLLNYELPKVVFEFLESFGLFKFDLNFALPLLRYEDSDDLLTMTFTPSEGRLEKLNLQYKSMGANYMFLAIIVIICIFISVSLSIIYKWYGCKEKVNLYLFQQKESSSYQIDSFGDLIMVKIYKIFWYNFFIVIFLESFLFIMILGMYEIDHYSRPNYKMKYYK